MAVFRHFGRKLNHTIQYGRKATHKLQGFGRKLNSFTRKGIHTLEKAAAYATPAVAGIAPEALPVLSGIEATLKKADRTRQKASRKLLN